MLLSKGADTHINAKMDFKFLDFAIWSSNLNILKRLIELGYDINMTNDDGNTYLHFVSAYAQPNTVDFLFNKGAVIKVNNRGEDQLSYAFMNWYEDYIECTHIGGSKNHEKVIVP